MKKEIINLWEALNEGAKEIIAEGISEASGTLERDDAVLVLLGYLWRAGFDVTLYKPRA